MDLHSDIAIIGAGASGLLLLGEILKDPNHQKKSIILIDNGERAEKNWAFWSKPKNSYENLIYHQWKSISFISSDSKKINQITAPYTYNLIVSKDLFSWMFDQVIPENKNVRVILGTVIGGEFNSSIKKIHLEDGSIIQTNILADSRQDRDLSDSAIELKQHFYGKLIETKESMFNSDQATLMDFNFPRVNNSVGFGYILPYSANKAFIEVTFFDEKPLSKNEYEKYWNEYWSKKLNGAKYKIINEEMGVIPMSLKKFDNTIKNGYFKIGTAAGMVKNSTGYAFTRMLKDAKGLVNSNFQSRHPRPLFHNRFKVYDHLLLSIIQSEPNQVNKIMNLLFKNNKPVLIFKFLDEETNILEEIKIFFNLPIPLFLKYLFKKIVKI